MTGISSIGCDSIQEKKNEAETPNESIPIEEENEATVKNESQEGEENKGGDSGTQDGDSNGEDGMIFIPGGTFTMGDNKGNPDESPAHEVTLSPFFIGVYEVTAGEYKACVNSGDCEYRGSTWSEATYNTDGKENHPINYVSWHDAQDYVVWLNIRSTDNYRLCSEAEWEYAARAGTTTRYWWGNQAPVCTLGSQNGAKFAEQCSDEVYGGDYGGGNAGSSCYSYKPPCFSNTGPVGSYSANPWGLYDVHGNVSEWVNDPYSREYYASSPYMNPQGPESGALRVNRGGSWMHHDIDLRSGYRGGPVWDFELSGNYGFRICADEEKTTESGTNATSPISNEAIDDQKQDEVVFIKNIIPKESYLFTRMTAVNNMFFLIGYDETHGEELWKSDGTPEGTVLVKDINVGYKNSNIRNMFAAPNGMLYFNTDDVQSSAWHSNKLWKSDGTPEGTIALDKDFVNGAIKDVLLFYITGDWEGSEGSWTGEEGMRGLDLWAGDGTEAGTHILVKDIGIVPLDYFPNTGVSYDRTFDIFFDFSGKLVFWTLSGESTVILWSFDGVDKPLRVREFDYEIRDIRMATTIPDSPLFFILNGKELWMSDTTPAGTSLVTSIYPETDQVVSDFIVVDKTLFFSVGFANSYNRELWKSDGTAMGTVRFVTVKTGAGSGEGGGPVPGSLLFESVNGTLFFIAVNKATNLLALWKSDGSKVGTVMVAETGQIYSMVGANGILYFKNRGLGVGEELWRSDGTELGTTMVQDMAPGYRLSSKPGNLTNIKGTLYFTTQDGTQDGLWKIQP